MNSGWHVDQMPRAVTVSGLGWLRVGLRGGAAIAILVSGLVLLLLLRLVERPICGLQRPVTPQITVVVCRLTLMVMGLRLQIVGEPMRNKGAVVANHSSWLDILVLNARKRLYFVAKSEVAGWPGIGWLARATGTVFIRRRGRDAQAQRDVLSRRLRAGHRLLIFPEGTSTDGTLVLPFKSTLFAAFFADELREVLSVQPVSVRYRSPDDDPGFYGWWGDMALAPHLLKVLAAPKQGFVTMTYHAPLRVADFADRKALALACEVAVRSGLVD